MASGGDPRRGDPRRIHRRPSRARSASPPPAHGGARAISQAARSSRAEVAPVSVRGCSVPPRRGDGGVSWRPRLESLRVATLMEDHGQTQAKMVHPQLRALLSHAMSRMNRAVLIDGAVLDELLQQISDALLQADFSLEMVSRMVSELRSKVSAMDLVASGSKHQIYQAINKALCRLIDSGKKPDFVPKKGKSCVILFVGLKGSGKTSSCAKFAYYHQHKGFSPSLVCANTSGNQPFHQLKQMAQQANIPCYGSHTEPDPVKIAVRYVEKMRKVNSDLIIIDTRGGHMSDESFFPEICNIEKATKPDLVILVVDAGGGRFSLDQAQTFKRKIPVGSVMITKMDDHSKGAGALNALAAAKLPVILFGTGKRMQDFETFDVKLFVNHLLDNKARVLGN